MEFSRQEHWSGLPFPSPGDLPDPGIKPGSPALQTLQRLSPGGSADKESTCNVGDLGLIPGLRRSPGEGKSYPTPVFWPGEFHGLYRPWGGKESD